MKKLYIVCLLSLFILMMSTNNFSNIHNKLPVISLKKGASLLKSSPIAIIENKGQINKKVIYYVKTGNYTIWIKKQGLVFDIKSKDLTKRSVIKMTFLTVNNDVKIVSGKSINGKTNIFKGKNKKDWVKNIKSFETITYKNIYKGIDLKIYSTNDGKIEYDWIIGKRAKPSDIKIKIEGSENIFIEKSGTLNINHSFGVYKHRIPMSFQTINNIIKKVESHFYKINKNTYGIKTGKYNPKYKLTIDPIIEQKYSTYVGGDSFDSVKSIAVDNSGYVYITGITGSTNFPTTTGAYDIGKGDGEYDIFVSKFSTTGKTLIYSSYIGGCCRDYATSIAIDVGGYAYITGYTESEDFPVTDSYQTIYGGGKTDAIIIKLGTDGTSLEYSTFLGGCDDDYGMGIATDSDSNFCSDNEGSAYVTGYTNGTDFPVSDTSYQSTNGGGIDAFVTKLSDDGSSLTYSTYFGGTLNDYGIAIAADCCGEASISGNTESSDFPTSSAFQSANGGESDVFITKFSSTGDSLKFSSYLGGNSNETASSIIMCMNCCGYTYVAGSTSSIDYPTILPFQNIYGGGYSDGFIAMITKTGTLTYSTYFGGVGRDIINGIALDSSRNIFITGNTDSNNIPVLNAFANNLSSTKNDAFISMLSQSGSNLLFSSYYGGTDHDIPSGIAIGCCGGIYLAGETESSDLPLLNTFQSTFSGGERDGFVSKFFFLPEDKVNITYPNGTETLEIGNTYSITWESSALNREINIELYSDGIFHSIIGKTNMGNNSYSWQIPSSIEINNKYKIRIYSDATEDFSDFSFSIVDTAPTVSIEAIRKKEYFWIVEKEYAEIKIIVENAASSIIAKYHIYRRETSGTYEVIKKLTKSELETGNFIYKNKYIDKSKSYKYKIIAYDTNNIEIGVSNEVSI